MLSGREVSLSRPTIISHHNYIPAFLVSTSFMSWRDLSLSAHRSLIPDSHMREQVMHFDAHIASEVSVIRQHNGDELYVVPGLLVAKKDLHDQNKSLSRFQFHFFHWVFKLWISWADGFEDRQRCQLLNLIITYTKIILSHNAKIPVVHKNVNYRHVAIFQKLIWFLESAHRNYP